MSDVGREKVEKRLADEADDDMPPYDRPAPAPAVAWAVVLVMMSLIDLEVWNFLAAVQTKNER
jgi:hypothetical protein